jgi:hypothetical protein
MLMRRSDWRGRLRILYAFDLIGHNGEEPRDRPFLFRKSALVLVLRNTKAGVLLNDHCRGRARPLPGYLDQDPQSCEGRCAVKEWNK